jgi:hypothetical protein
MFLAGTAPDEDRLFAGALAAASGLPLLEPDTPHHAPLPEGWGPHYSASAAADSWLIRSSSWHAVEPLMARAQLVIARPGAGQPDLPKPESRTWRILFAPWWRRYPRIEKSLLTREIEGHGHNVPVVRLFSEAEGQLVLDVIAEHSPALTSP